MTCILFLENAQGCASEVSLVVRGVPDAVFGVILEVETTGVSNANIKAFETSDGGLNGISDEAVVISKSKPINGFCVAYDFVCKVRDNGRLGH